jgi:IrrE N-terminal-like domain
MHSQNRRKSKAGFARLLSKAHGDRDARALVKDFARELYWRIGRSRPPFLAADYARILDVPVAFRDIAAEGVQTDTAALAMVAAHRGNDLLTGIEGTLHLDTKCRPVIVLQRPKHYESTSVVRRRNFTLAHEIGHYVMRRAVSGYCPLEALPIDDPEEERLANIFASEILMPPNRLIPDLVSSGNTLKGLVDICDKYEVSLQALLSKVCDLDRESFAFMMHRARDGRVELVWSIPGESRRIITSDSARLWIQRTWDSEATLDNGLSPTQHEFIIDGRTTRWSLESHRLMPVGIVVSWLRRSARKVSWLPIPASRSEFPRERQLPLGF